jgi:hypothetical protein
MKRNDVFLESITGDYYGYNKETKVWFPMGNVGLHHSQTLETYGNAASLFVTKIKKYKQNGLFSEGKLGG